MADRAAISQLSQAISSTIDALNQSSSSHQAQSHHQLESLKERLTALIDDNLQNAKARLSARVDELVLKLDSELDQSCADMKTALEMRDRDITALGYCEKVHVRQAALISRMLYSMEIRTVYNIFIALMINLAIVALVLDYISEKEFYQGWSVLFDSFGKWGTVMQGMAELWLLSLFPLLYVRLRQKGLWAWVLVLGHFAYLTAYGLFAWRFVLDCSLPIASSFVILCEATRMGMKMHSYLREKLLYGFPNRFTGVFLVESPQQPQIHLSSLHTEFKQYVYFSFAPTLIYRDQYPTLPRQIRWVHVGVHLFNFFAGIFFTAIMFKCHTVPNFTAISMERLTASTVAVAFISSVLPGTMVFLNLFFGVNHSLQSLFAELLSFADRRFYSDWWNAEGPEDFYKGLCVPVYEWFATYIYMDVQRFSNRLLGPAVACLLTGTFAGLVFEAVIDTSLRISFPLVFVLFTLPLSLQALYPLRSRVKICNVFLWVSLLLVLGLLTGLFFLECQAKTQGLVHQNGLWGEFVPLWVPKLTLV